MANCDPGQTDKTGHVRLCPAVRFPENRRADRTDTDRGLYPCPSVRPPMPRIGGVSGRSGDNQPSAHSGFSPDTRRYWKRWCLAHPREISAKDGLWRSRQLLRTGAPRTPRSPLSSGGTQATVNRWHIEPEEPKAHRPGRTCRASVPPPDVGRAHDTGTCTARRIGRPAPACRRIASHAYRSTRATPLPPSTCCRLIRPARSGQMDSPPSGHDPAARLALCPKPLF